MFQADSGGVFNYDEISAYLNARYVGPTESCWRIYGFRMHDHSHSIVRLPVLLPNHQQVYFVEGEEKAALATARRTPSMLQEYFSLNNKNEAEAREVLYKDITSEYRWNRGWNVRRQTTQTFGRLHFVDPKNIELLYLRALMLHVTDAKSFEDLLTIHGVTHASFKAAIALDIAKDDDEWRRCMTEAARYRSPFSLRNLFAILCVYCGVVNPENLLDEFKDILSEDFTRIYHDSTVAFALCCRELDIILQSHNTSFRQVIGYEVPQTVATIQEQRTRIPYGCTRL